MQRRRSRESSLGKSLVVGLWVVSSVLLLTCSLPSYSLVLPPNDQVFNVLDYGAVGDGTTKDTNAVASAYQAAESNGGGVVYFPAGNYLVGSFNVTNNTVLYVDDGATILGSTDPNDYPIIPPLPSYGTGRDIPGPRYASLVHGQNLTNVSVLGNGVINGQGDPWYELFLNKSLLHSRPSVIEFMWATNVRLQNITILNSPFWTVHPVYCDNVVVDNITIINPPTAPNTDGVDPDSSTNVLVTNSHISCGDDCIAVKSGLDQYGINYAHPSINVTISNNHFGYGMGLSIGSEMSGGVYNVIFVNNTCNNTQRIVRIKSGIVRGGEVSDITYLNNTGESVQQAISFDMYKDSNTTLDGMIAPPIVRNVWVQDLYVVGTSNPGEFDCLSEAPCTNLTFINVNIPDGKASLWDCEYATGTATNVFPPMPTGCLDNQYIPPNNTFANSKLNSINISN